MSLTIPYIISQILVIIYYVIYSFTYQMKDSNKILKYGIVATIISAFSYVLLGAYTGMAMCGVAIVRNILFTKYNKNKINLIIILLLTVICSIFTWDGVFCLFNIVATLIYTYALWQKNTRTYKILGIIVNGLMIVYDIYIKSIFGVVLITISFVSSIIGYIREDKNE